MADRDTERERLANPELRPGSAAGYEFSYEADAPRVTTDPDAAGMTNGRTLPRDRSLASLLKELRDETTTLVRQEVALAKTELSDKAAVAGRNAGAIAGGAAVATAGALVLLFGLCTALYFGLDAIGLPNWLSGILAFPVLGAVIALIGYGMIKKGVNTLKNLSPVPEKTVETLKEDKQWLTNQVK